MNNMDAGNGGTRPALLQINPADNVAVALRPLRGGERIRCGQVGIDIAENVPQGHKVALREIPEGGMVIKYGAPIGHVVCKCQAGAWLNERNVQTNLAGLLSYEYHPVPCPSLDSPDGRTFMGYRRKNGLVGVRNEVWIIPTVGCVNGIVRELAVRMRVECGAQDVVPFTHDYGCSQLGDDHLHTMKILRGMVRHPNAGAVLVVGLGCENNQVEQFRQFCGDIDEERVKFVTVQEVKGNEADYCMSVLRELHRRIQDDVRTACPLSELTIGLKCGGSDGFSGITANPLLGVFSDYIVAQGGRSILTEVPEMFGAEMLLMSRCTDRHVFDQVVALINDFKDYYLSHGQPVGENPSPGNKAGGISTLEEKALGCTQKSGTSPVRAVVAYGDAVTERGLSLLYAPGNDLVASTALAAAGCQLVLFSTGRGTPFGTFVPTMKISTNTLLARNKPRWIDFDAGPLIDGVDMHELARSFADQVIRIASGEPTQNEVNGYRDMAIFKTGVTL